MYWLHRLPRLRGSRGFLCFLCLPWVCCLSGSLVLPGLRCVRGQPCSPCLYCLPDLRDVSDLLSVLALGLHDSARGCATT